MGHVENDVEADAPAGNFRYLAGRGKPRQKQKLEELRVA